MFTNLANKLGRHLAGGHGGAPAALFALHSVQQRAAAGHRGSHCVSGRVRGSPPVLPRLGLQDA